MIPANEVVLRLRAAAPVTNLVPYQRITHGWAKGTEELPAIAVFEVDAHPTSSEDVDTAEESRVQVTVTADRLDKGYAILKEVRAALAGGWWSEDGWQLIATMANRHPQPGTNVQTIFADFMVTAS